MVLVFLLWKVSGAGYLLSVLASKIPWSLITDIILLSKQALRAGRQEAGSPSSFWFLLPRGRAAPESCREPF